MRFNCKFLLEQINDEEISKTNGKYFPLSITKHEIKHLIKKYISISKN